MAKNLKNNLFIQTFFIHHSHKLNLQKLH